MDLREQRGKQIAETGIVKKASAGEIWQVPSQSGSGYYKVDLAGENPVCNCPDFELRNKPCKHVYAVAYVVVHQLNQDGSTIVTETVSVSRKTYPQNWPKYNAAQTTDQDKFQELLCELCSGVPVPESNPGRPPMPISDAVFSAAFKIYSTMSGRRFMSDLREAHRRGYISHIPHYNSIFNYLENESLTPIRQSLIAESSLPLKTVEVDFAVDSSGFTTSKFTRWYDKKYRRVREKHDWVKAHLICGVRTNVVTAIQIADRDANDSPFMAPLVEATAKNFKISDGSGGKAYSTVKNFETVCTRGGLPVVPFRGDPKGGRGGCGAKSAPSFIVGRGGCP